MNFLLEPQVKNKLSNLFNFILIKNNKVLHDPFCTFVKQYICKLMNNNKNSDSMAKLQVKEILHAGVGNHCRNTKPALGNSDHSGQQRWWWSNKSSSTLYRVKNIMFCMRAGKLCHFVCP